MLTVVEPGGRAKFFASELRASAGLDFLNDFVWNCYFGEEGAENVEVCRAARASTGPVLITSSL